MSAQKCTCRWLKRWPDGTVQWDLCTEGSEFIKCPDCCRATTLNTPQPPPGTDDAGPEVWPTIFETPRLPAWLAADMKERHEAGTRKYGTPLRVWNGRDAVVDAYPTKEQHHGSEEAAEGRQVMDSLERAQLHAKATHFEAEATKLRLELEKVTEGGFNWAKRALRYSAEANAARAALRRATDQEAQLRGLLAGKTREHEEACALIARMHAGAVGEVRGPSAEPTPRDMRVAEAVREQIARHIRMSPRFEGQLTTPNDNGLLGRVAQEIENLDLAAVVAKALEVGT